MSSQPLPCLQLSETCIGFRVNPSPARERPRGLLKLNSRQNRDTLWLYPREGLISTTVAQTPDDPTAPAGSQAPRCSVVFAASCVALTWWFIRPTQVQLPRLPCYVPSARLECLREVEVVGAVSLLLKTKSVCPKTSPQSRRAASPLCYGSRAPPSLSFLLVSGRIMASLWFTLGQGHRMGGGCPLDARERVTDERWWARRARPKAALSCHLHGDNC